MIRCAVFCMFMAAFVYFNAYPQQWSDFKEYFTYRCKKGTLGYTINYGNCRPPEERP